MALANSLLKRLTPLQQLLEDINFQRTKEMRQLLKDESGFVVLQGTTYWTDLFVRHFLFQSEPSQIDSDDLLFFVRKKHVKSSSRNMPKYESEIDVFRKDSRKLPVGDPDVDWEETVYLNMVIHQFDYILTLAICTRTSPKELQVLKRHSQRVYASPSKRKMDSKGEGEEITYPHICFMVDNYDEVFSDILVRDGEMVCVELVANDKDGSVQGVIFLGSIRYDALKKVYDARQSSLSTKVAQRMSFGLFNSGSTLQTRCEFVRMKGPNGKGHAEMAVTKPKGSGVETPTSEPGFCATDMWDEWNIETDEYCNYRHQRRLSDPSANLNSFSKCSWRTKNSSNSYGACGGAKARSENEGLDLLASEITEIEAGDLKDDLYPAFSAEAKLHINAYCENMQSHKDVPKKQTENNFHKKDTIGVNTATFTTVTSKRTNDTNEKQNNCVSTGANKNVPEMSEIYHLHSKDVSNNTPACLNIMPKKQSLIHRENVRIDSSGFHVIKWQQSNTNSDIIYPNTFKKKSPQSLSHLIKKDKNKTKIKDKDNLKEKSSNVKMSIFTKFSSKTKTTNELSKNIDIGKIEKDCKGGENFLKQYELANDAISLKDYKINSNTTEQISLINDSDEGLMINVQGKEELPVVQETRKSVLTKESKMKNTKIFQLKKVFHTDNLKIPPESAKNSELENDQRNIKVTTYNKDNETKNNAKTDICKSFIVQQESLSQQSNIFKSNECVPHPSYSILQQTKLNKSLNTVPKRRTPDGTNIYYWCDFPKTLIKELDDGAYNPIWASRGSTQSFHFWKENRRQSSAPLNAFLTYVTLPWWSIAKDLLDHREAPILTF